MILPGPPYKISQGYVRARLRVAGVIGLLGAAFLAFGGWLAWAEAKTILQEAEIWRRGETALSASVEGEETSRYLIFRRYQLNVSFLSIDEIEHSGPVEFETVFGWVDSRLDPSVHYLPSEPQSFALSWGQDVTAYRWVAAAVFAAFGIVLGGLVLYFPASVLMELRAVRACSLRSEEIALSVAKVTPTTPDGLTVRYELQGASPWGHGLKQTFVAQPPLGGPIFMDEGQTKVLALVSPELPNRAVVVRDTLFPFELTPDAIAQIRSRL